MRRVLATQLGTYVVAIGLASVLWGRPGLLTVCYVVLGSLMLIQSHRTLDVTFYLVAFVLGPAGEAVAVRSGAWQYARPTYLVPIWLPFLWGIAALTMKRLAEATAAWVAPRERLL